MIDIHFQYIPLICEEFLPPGRYLSTLFLVCTGSLIAPVRPNTQTESFPNEPNANWGLPSLLYK